MTSKKLEQVQLDWRRREGAERHHEVVELQDQSTDLKLSFNGLREFVSLRHSFHASYCFFIFLDS